MRKATRIIIFGFLAWAYPHFLSAQTNDAGAIGSLSVSKDIGRNMGATVEQEFRFNQNISSFDRSLTSVGVDYSIIKKLLKAEANYDLIYQRQDTYFEFKHRASASLSAQMKYNSFGFKLRTRGQSTWRDESRGDYKFNPKYVWRNKLECEYTIFGSPVKPFVSGEIFCPINGANGFFMDGYRAVIGAKYRTSARTTLEFLLRYDQEVQVSNPKTMLYGGVGWNYKL